MNTSLTVENVMLLDDNGTNVTSTSKWEMEIWYWRVLLYAVGGVCIACVGTVCNIISMLVLVHFRNSSSAPFLLICLAIFDSVYLVSTLFLECLPVMESGQVINWGYRDFMFPVYMIFFPLPLLAQTWVTYIVVVITIERFLVVAWPFLAYKFCSMKSARFTVAVIVVLGTLYHIPTYMAFVGLAEWENTTQQWIFKFARTEFGSSFVYTQIYEKWSSVCVNFAIPFAILLFFNVLMVKLLRRNKDEMVIRRIFSRDEQRLTFMVFCMTLIFFVCELLAAMSKVVLASYTNYRHPSKEANRFSAVADTLMLVNSAINFAIYCVTGRKFRQTFVQLFCGCKNKTDITKVFAVASVQRSKQEYSRSRISSASSCSKSSIPRRSTTNSSLSSYSNGNKSSQFTHNSDSVHSKLVVMVSDQE